MKIVPMGFSPSAQIVGSWVTLVGWVVALIWATNKVDDPVKGGVKLRPAPPDPILWAKNSDSHNWSGWSAGSCVDRNAALALACSYTARSPAPRADHIKRQGIMPILRSYIDDDWQAVLEICLLAFTPIHELFERSLGAELFRLVYPDWKASNEEYLRSLTEVDERERLFVVDENRVVVGFVHFAFDPEKQMGTIGLNAVHPAHQGKGVGTLMYRHVLEIMRARGMKYVKVGTGGDLSHAPARHAYEKVGFVPIPVVHYFKALTDSENPMTHDSNSVGAVRRPRLVIVCGLPGSGKTTHAKQIERNLRAVRLCPDEWMSAMEIDLWESQSRERIERLQWKLAQKILSLGHSVVIEWGTWAKSERDALRIGARDLGAAVELHFLDAPIGVLHQRIRGRKLESPPITFDDLAKWAESFERPSAEEMALFDAPLP
jgi:predicted kinase/GNAT superfamily N-acetyltransferase